MRANIMRNPLHGWAFSLMAPLICDPWHARKIPFKIAATPVLATGVSAIADALRLRDA